MTPPTGRLRARILGIVAVALASCVVFTGRQGDSIRFPEAAHADLIVDCGTCHEGVGGHQVGSDTRRELEAACLQCHAERKDDCAWCHADVASAGVFPDHERSLSFSHEAHLVRTHGDCDACHAGAHGQAAATAASHVSNGSNGSNATASSARAAVMPAHAECFSCHQMQHFYDQLECANCHRDLARFGLEPYEKFTHTVDFVRRGHAELARSPTNSAVCSQCHESSFCDDCHFTSTGLTPPQRAPMRVDRDFIHRGDYVFRHPWDARADPASCLRCHGQSYCEDCHDARGVSEKGALKRTDGFHFHGPGVMTPGASDFHGTAARRDILSCSTCHSEGTSGSCVSCHAVGAFGGNPHPPGFKSRLNKKSAPVCRVCHG